MSGRAAHHGEAKERHGERQGVGTEVRCHGQRARAQDRPTLRWVVGWWVEGVKSEEWEAGNGEWGMKSAVGQEVTSGHSNITRVCETDIGEQGGFA